MHSNYIKFWSITICIAQSYTTTFEACVLLILGYWPLTPYE